jgi:hypothetical protein
MKLGPLTVAEIILTDLPLDAPPEPLNAVIERIVSKYPESGGVPVEKAALWAPKVQVRLEKHWNESIEAGKQPRFAFNSVSDYKIQGGCFVEPCDTPEVKDQKRRRLRWRDYYDFLRNLTPDHFELVCSRILGLIGVPKPVLTPYRKDQGIDFFGRMSIADLTGHGALFPVFERDLILWLVGQAKHYPDSRISTPDIRALAGSAFLSRVRAFPKDGELPHLNVRACDPMVMLFFTTGQISSDGWALCRRAGIAAMDGERVAAFLADKQVGLEGEGELQKFSLEAFAVWLEVDLSTLNNRP